MLHGFGLKFLNDEHGVGTVMGLLWFTPVVTLDRIVLTGVWTVYIFIGSSLKDRRLVHYAGRRYRIYQSRVPGYPFLFAGPLGRKPFHPHPIVKTLSATSDRHSHLSSKSAA